MKRIAFYGLLFLTSYMLLRWGCVQGAVSSDRLAVIYAGVLVPLALATSGIGVSVTYGILAGLRRIGWAHVRWYFVDAWLASGFVLALILAFLTIPLRNAVHLGSLGVARLLVDRVVPKGVSTAQREAAWKVFEKFWRGEFLPALASENEVNWDRALNLLDDFVVAYGDGIQPGELEQLERELRAAPPPPLAPP